MKKLLAIVLAMVMILSLAACASKPADNTKPSDTKSTDNTTKATEPKTTDAAKTDVTIELWTYPVGNWGNEAEVAKLTDAFTAETGIKVKVEYLAYADGDDKINAALTAGKAPDLVLEGPERLVANWGAAGYMVDLKDMLDDTDRSEILPACLTACTATDGSVYEYPLVMTAHCMAINLDAFKEAGADQYVDLTTRTWTTENFVKAVAALNEKFGGNVAAVFCGGQGGDQGTRALVNNLYGGTYTNAEHTAYTWDDANNVKALELLKSMDGINFDAAMQGGDEIAMFYQEVLKMAFCWNIAQQLNPNQAGTGVGKTMSGQEIAIMAFPSENGAPQLCGGIWGFGIFNNGDEARIEAAKQFIRWMADSEHTVDAVKTANFFAARTSAEGTDLSGIWADNETMNEYQVLMPYLGDYYNVTKGWAQARTSWWNMLQKVGEGADIKESLTTYAAEANAAAKG